MNGFRVSDVLTCTNLVERDENAVEWKGWWMTTVLYEHRSSGVESINSSERVFERMFDHFGH